MQIRETRLGPWVTVGGAVLALVGAAGVAWANSGDDGLATVRLKCRTFPTEIGAEVDTRDPGSPLGEWVVALEDRGWEVASIQWDVGQKVTGFPQGYTQVCLSPIRR